MKINIKNADKITIKGSSDIYGIMRLILKREQLVDRTKEHFWTIALSIARKILNIELVSMGTRKAVGADPIEVFSIPLQKKASRLILAHNHPTGRLQPSEADLDITNRLIQAGLIVDVEVLDHLIISEHSFFSFKDNGLIDKLRWDRKYALTFVREKQVKKEIEQMKKLGEQQGLEKGLLKGRKAERMEIAKNLLRQGLDFAVIERATGVSKSWLGRLKNEIWEKEN